MCVCRLMSAIAHLWRSENNFLRRRISLFTLLTQGLSSFCCCAGVSTLRSLTQQRRDCGNAPRNPAFTWVGGWNSDYKVWKASTLTICWTNFPALAPLLLWWGQAFVAPLALLRVSGTPVAAEQGFLTPSVGCSDLGSRSRSWDSASLSCDTI